ncbi:MAG: hypothetical protein [Myoviridae sp. ctThM1]|nr:MAG: hypothetical protein [Myoviridae sp. ctThM1]
MRTQEQFYKIWQELKWFVAFHDKPVWLVPLKDCYKLSVVAPCAENLPCGTSANLYNTNLEIIEYINSTC